MENGDTLVTKDVKDSGSVATRKFTDDGFVMVSNLKPIVLKHTITRNFRACLTGINKPLKVER